ncbi:signal peptidase I [Microbacterium sp. ASV81]|uniref:Signal peptidase I n=1 Tax=Microbacterium capsulatum TaxID=3041921 RepID=A0ABU0XGP3_9MICO|nr:signal peptidase I [Microbacterium sp. ASV81]MDQ4214298.1 signal peptidase I [Microbacterium sp. ASV81]
MTIDLANQMATTRRALRDQQQYIAPTGSVASSSASGARVGPRAGGELSTSAGTRRGPRAGRVLGEVLLWVAALAGLASIALVILAMTAHITLIMFRTGSMAPTIPTGSVAIVQQIPASEVHVGDVVTVDRPGLLPVTHRVREVAAGSTPQQRTLTLRGDANAQDDTAPYAVSTVRIVRYSVPGLAPLILLLGDPFVIGGFTVGAASLIVWAFWPKDGRRSRRDEQAQDAATDAVGPDSRP